MAKPTIPEGSMRTILVFSVFVMFVFAFASTALAAPNPGNATEVKSPASEEKQPQPKPATTGEKEHEWLDVRVSLAFGYDSNVALLNRDLALVPEYNTTKVVTTVTLRAQIGETSRWKFGAQYDFYNAMHDKAEYMQLQSHSFMFYSFFASSPHYLYIPANINFYLLDYETFMYSIRLMPTYYYEQSNSWLLSITAGSEILNYKDPADRDYDAMDHQFRIAETYMFNRDTWVRGSLGYNYYDASADHNSYSAARIAFDYRQPLMWQIQLDASFTFQYRDYRLLDPVDTKPREDRRTILSLKLSRPIEYGISAFVSFDHIENASKIDRYRYVRDVILLGFEWKY